ncbi:preprotein translocase subunit SecF [Bacillus sp. TS-2]|nr:preprotein translocase subunit SecF [Bacillus sp. TS-2]
MNFKTHNLQLDFVKHRNKFFLFSGLFSLLGIILLFTIGFNLGIDFQSGSRVEILAPNTITAEEIQEQFERMEGNLVPDDITLAGESNEIANARFTTVLDNETIQMVQNHFANEYGIEPSVSTVSPLVGEELAKNAFISVLIAAVGITIYVAFRFELLFGIAAIVGLLHDALFVLMMFSLFQIEINIPFIAAILTVVGYSINDTIVTFDRIRENVKFSKKIKGFQDLANIVNKSIVQTLARSINTALTIAFAAVAIMIFGGEAVRSFAFALVIGLIAGTYSSMFLCAQLWVVWKAKAIKNENKKSKRKELEPTP